MVEGTDGAGAEADRECRGAAMFVAPLPPGHPSLRLGISVTGVWGIDVAGLTHNGSQPHLPEVVCYHQQHRVANTM